MQGLGGWDVKRSLKAFDLAKKYLTKGQKVSILSLFFKYHPFMNIVKVRRYNTIIFLFMCLYGSNNEKPGHSS